MIGPLSYRSLLMTETPPRSTSGRSRHGEEDARHQRKNQDRRQESHNLENEAEEADSYPKPGQSDRLKAGMQKYLDQALSTLDKLGISARDDVPRLISCSKRSNMLMKRR
ncbi:MAG: hypothetical protein R3B91_14340 [Planctomycetaceae bacterium]